MIPRLTLVYSLAALLLLLGGCGSSATTVSTPTPDTQRGAAAPVPGATYHYSTVGSCDCAVLPTAVATSTLTPTLTATITAATGAGTISPQWSPLLAVNPLTATLRAGNQLGPIDDYIVYYGQGQADVLKQFDLAIVQPETLTSEELADVQAAGTKVVAYLSVGEAEGGRPWWPQVNLDWILGRNENWGSLFVDAGEKGWQDLLLDVAIPSILKDKPFDGLFLDTLDTVDVYAETKPGMVELVKRMRERYPDLILVQNRGFTVLDETGPAIDAVMFESMSSDFDFSARTYSMVEREEEPAFVQEMARKHGLVGLVMDYALPEDFAAIRHSYQRALEYGFVPYVSTIELDRTYVHNFDAIQPDVRATGVSYRQEGDDDVLATVTLANYGLADAAGVPVRFLIGRDHRLQAQTELDLTSGASTGWEVTWQTAPQELTLVRVEAGSSVYETTFAGIQPALDVTKQRLRSGNGLDLLAQRVDTPPVTDADLSEWQTLTPTASIDQAANVGFVEKPELAWTGPGDLSAQAWLRWDDENLYLAMDVTDDALVQRLWGEGIWKGDHVELWLDTQLQADFDEDVAGDDDFQLGFSPGSADGTVAPGIAIWQPALLRADYEAKIQYASQLNNHGYQFEAAIPWELLNADRPRAGLAYGITIEPSDTDTPKRAAQELMMSTSPESPSHWGNPTLRNNLILQ
jgi:uncharacterized protein (TIGR01370 family)